MTTIQIEAGDLLASADDRVISGLLLPFGEVGRTNLGKVTVGKGAVRLPADPSVVTLNLDHERNQPVGRAVTLHASDRGVHASFDVARTPEGDDLLASAKRGERTKLSVELADLVIRAGKVVSARLYGAAAVTAGAFPSAGLFAADAGDLAEDVDSTSTTRETITVDGVEYVRVTTSSFTSETTPVDGAPADDTETDPATDDTEAPAEDTTEEDDIMARAAAPAGTRPATTAPKALVTTAQDLFAQVAKAHSTRDGDLHAALADITSASHTPNVTVPQFVGELWDGVGYERQYIPLFGHADLTSWTVAGWRWTTKPEVGKYAGNKTAIPSNVPVTAPVSIEAERIAGGHDIDRKFKDFGDTGFIESYYRAMTESYAEVSDLDVLAQVVDALTPAGFVPGPASVNPGLAGVVRGYFKVLRATRRRPTFALLNDVDFEDLMFTVNDDVTPYLEKLLGLGSGDLLEGFLRPTVDLEEGQALVGVKDAVTVHELGGGAPIRVEALDIANGGIDHGVFGYTAVNIHRLDGVALMDAGIVLP